jgi:type II secretory ATPase GspE/PulE/Tfp pilus assembly ATPase PilB-like protein
MKQLNMDPASIQSGTFLRGKGCGNCANTGYRGGLASFEIFVIDDDHRES